jgi:hypothetical protein
LPAGAQAITLAAVRHPFRRKNLSPRLLPFYAAAAASLALARPAPGALAAGGALVLAGVALRVWSVGHLVKNEELTWSGPYAHLRHPLYAGTLLLGIGFGAMAGPWGLALLALFFLPVFFLYYLPYKDRIEGARLERRYGVQYTRYREAVPALVPSLAAFSPPREWSAAGRRWSGDRFLANGELGTLAGVGLALAALSLRLALGS